MDGVSRQDLQPALGFLPWLNQCVCDTIGFDREPQVEKRKPSAAVQWIALIGAKLSAVLASLGRSETTCNCKTGLAPPPLVLSARPSMSGMHGKPNL